MLVNVSMKNMAKKLLLTEGDAILDQCHDLFSRQGFPRSATEILKIKNELHQDKDFNMLTISFKILQTTFINEYSVTPHRTLCSTFFKKRVNLTLKLNVRSLNRIFKNIGWAKMIEHRVKSRNVLFILDRVLRKGVKTDEEKSIGLSYLYLASIDGVYGKNLKDIVIFDILSKGKTVNFSEVENMKLKDIKDYFSNVQGSECLFDGWDENIRNAIAHSSFWINPENGKTVYEDRYSEVVKEKTFDEIFYMLQNLSDLDLLVFYYNQIHRINKVIMDLK